MSEANTVSLKILDKDYLVACPEESRQELEKAATHLDKKMRDIRASGKVFGTERIAVMAALNITYELLERSELSSENSQLFASLEEKLDKVLPEN